MSTRRRRLLPLLVALVGILAIPSAAQAKSSDVVDADVSLRLAPDAALLVTEQLTFDYDGAFHASYRDIPLDAGQTVSRVVITEGESVYQEGGCTTFGCFDQTGRFGVTQIPEGGGVRIVWHHNASNRELTFNVSYRVDRQAVAYDDVIDAYWKVWGDQWDFELDHLTANLKNPALDPNDPLYRVWGHPREVEGETVRGSGEATLEADDVRDHQFVELRVTIPRQPGQNVSGARRGDGEEGLPGILEEEQDTDDDFNSPFNKAKRWIGHNAILLALLLAAVALGGLAVMRFMAREHAIP